MLKGAQLNFACKHKKTHDNCRKKKSHFRFKNEFCTRTSSDQKRKKYLTYAQNSSFLNIWKENQKWGINTIQLKAVRRERMVVVETSWYRQYFNSSFFSYSVHFFQEPARAQVKIDAIKLLSNKVKYKSHNIGLIL